jgi:hypothetical protein
MYLYIVIKKQDIMTSTTKPFFNFNRPLCMRPEMLSLVTEVACDPMVKRTKLGNMLMGLTDGFFYIDMYDVVTAMYNDDEISHLIYAAVMVIYTTVKDYPRIPVESVHAINLS